MITITPAPEKEASCYSCLRFKSRTLPVFDLGVKSGGRTDITPLCQDCLNEVCSKAFPFRSGRFIFSYGIVKREDGWSLSVAEEDIPLDIMERICDKNEDLLDKVYSSREEARAAGNILLSCILSDGRTV